MCDPSKNCLVSVPLGTAGWAYSIRPYNRVRAILRNTDAILQLGTCEGSKNGSVFATVGGVWWGVFDTPLRPGMGGPSKNGSVYTTVGGVWWGVCDTPLRLGTCGPSKNYLVFVPVGGVWWGVFDTPLRPGTYDPSKYRCDFPTGCVRFFEILMQHPDRIRATLRNTDTTPRPDTCDPSKYRYDLSTGGAGIFGRWGGGGYRLRGRRA